MNVIRLNPAQAVLLVVDLQEKLVPRIEGHAAIVARAAKLIQAARQLGLPLIWSEQYKKGLGETVAPIRDAVGVAAVPHEKLAFGCFGDEGLSRALAATGRRQLILCGVETHVCILQTALAALAAGWDVFLAEDAIGSQRAADREAGLARMIQAGAVPASAEMLILEAVGAAGTPSFKAILPLLKD